MQNNYKKRKSSSGKVLLTVILVLSIVAFGIFFFLNRAAAGKISKKNLPVKLYNLAEDFKAGQKKLVPNFDSEKFKENLDKGLLDYSVSLNLDAVDYIERKTDSFNLSGFLNVPEKQADLNAKLVIEDLANADINLLLNDTDLYLRIPQLYKKTAKINLKTAVNDVENASYISDDLVPKESLKDYEQFNFDFFNLYTENVKCKKEFFESAKNSLKNLYEKSEFKDRKDIENGYNNVELIISKEDLKAEWNSLSKSYVDYAKKILNAAGYTEGATYEAAIKNVENSADAVEKSFENDNELGDIENFHILISEKDGIIRKIRILTKEDYTQDLMISFEGEKSPTDKILVYQINKEEYEKSEEDLHSEDLMIFERIFGEQRGMNLVAQFDDSNKIFEISFTADKDDNFWLYGENYDESIYCEGKYTVDKERLNISVDELSTNLNISIKNLEIEIGNSPATKELPEAEKTVDILNLDEKEFETFSNNLVLNFLKNFSKLIKYISES